MNNRSVFLIAIAFLGFIATQNSHAMLRQLQSSTLMARLKQTSFGTKLALAGTAIAATAGIVWAAKKHREDLRIKKIMDNLPPDLVNDRMDCKRIVALAQPKGITVTLEGLLARQKTTDGREIPATIIKDLFIHSYGFNEQTGNLNIYVRNEYGTFVIENYNILSGAYSIQYYHDIFASSSTNQHTLATKQGTLSANDIKDKNGVYEPQKLSLHYVPGLYS